MKNWKWFVTLIIIIALPICSYLYLQLGALKIHVQLPKYFPEEVKEGTKDTVYHTIPDFKFYSQNGEIITPETFKDKIYVADFFFTTCKGICKKMSSNLSKVQGIYKNNDEVKIISYSVNSVADSIPVLKSYAAQYGAIDGKWYLVTGDKKEIYELARIGYKLPVGEGDGGADDFIHSERFVLVDKDKIVRGFYDGTDSVQINYLIEDIRLLLREYHLKK